MKRYVKEFANDMIKSCESWQNPAVEGFAALRIAGINGFLQANEVGLVSDLETVRSIVRIMETETIDDCWWAEYSFVKRYRKGER